MDWIVISVDKSKEDITLKDWNRYLVDILFPKGLSGSSRLFLTPEDIEELSKKTGLTKEEVVEELYKTTSADDMPETVERRIKEYKRFLREVPERVKNSYGIDEEDDEYKDKSIEEYLNKIPPFLANLVVIVHAYMYGDRASVGPGDVYETVANEISEVLGIEKKDDIRDDLKRNWHSVTGMREYKIEEKKKKIKIGNHSPWVILKKWTEIRDRISKNGALTLDTCEIETKKHGYVGPIKYNAPFVSDDRKKLECFGKELRGVSDVKPSRIRMLQYAKENKRKLSKRARKTLEEAFDEDDEGAACFVEYMNKGFKSGPTDEDEEEGTGMSENIKGIKNRVRFEVSVRTGFHGDLRITTRLSSDIDSDEEFIITIGEEDISIPVDRKDGTKSAPLEEYMGTEDFQKSIDLVGEYKVKRGKRESRLDDDLVRTLQPKSGGWKEAEPSSEQPLMVLSKEPSLKEFKRNEGIRDVKELGVIDPNSIYEIDGQDIYGIKGVWPRQSVVSKTSDFDLEGGIKSDDGHNRFLFTAPPRVTYDGSRSPEDFEVIQHEGSDEKKKLIFQDGGWILSPPERSEEVKISVKLNEEQKWSTEVRFIEEESRWRDFLREDIYDGYEVGDVVLPEGKNEVTSGMWERHKKRINEEIRKRLTITDDKDELENLWISFKKARKRIKQLRAIEERKKGRTFGKKDEKIGGETGKKEDGEKEKKSAGKNGSETEYVPPLDKGCDKDCKCCLCKRQRTLIKQPNNDQLWERYGPEDMEMREKYLEDLKKIHPEV